MMIRFLVLFLCFYTNCTLAQEITIKGVLRNTDNSAISGASVLLKKDNKIKTFAHTNLAGKYSIVISKADFTGSILEVNHIAYISEQIALISGQEEYNFLLKIKENRIEEIAIGRPVPIRQRQDTLSFSITAFVDSIDRSIGDVLKRIPGFDVSDNGKINFNGQDISHFFIDGDDVLGSKYGLGTRNIPHDVIRTIELYRNHQAIKALGDKVNSNKIALNLNLKEDAKAQWIGEVKGGLGLPKQYLIASNILRFSPVLKTINVVMSNNLGHDLDIGTKDLTPTSPTDLALYALRLGNSQPINEGNTSFYKSHGLASSFNLFFKLKNHWTARSNLGFYLEKRLLKAFNAQQFNLPEYNFYTEESIDLVHKPLKAHMNIQLMRNLESMYISNHSKLNFSLHQSQDKVLSTTLSLTENLKQQRFVFENNFSFIPNNNGENFWRLEWNTQYKNVPERLHLLGDSIIPVISLFETSNLLNQQISNRTFNSKVDLYYFIQRSSLSQNYGLEAAYENSNLFSELRAYQKEQSWTRVANFYNDLYWNRSYVGGYGSYQFNKGKLKSSLKIPLGLQYTNYKDENYALNDHTTRLLFNPFLNVMYILSPSKNLTFQYFSQQNLGEMSDVYRSFILTDFRSISYSTANLPRTDMNQIKIRYAHENASKMSFWNFNYSYNILKSNVSSAFELSPDAISIAYVLNKNTQFTHEFGLKVGQFLKSLAGTSSLEIKYKVNSAEQIFNTIKQELLINNMQVYPQIEWKMGNIQGRYLGAWSWFWAGNLHSDIPNKGNVLTHSASLTYSNQSKLFLTGKALSMSTSNSNSTSNSRLLLSSDVRYKASKKREYGVQLSNILNQKLNSSYIMESGYSFYQENAYRGRMVLFTVLNNF